MWLLYDKDEKVGRIGNLYVYDALGKTTFNNKIEVTELESGIYKLTLVIDETFLKDATYPVVIDPTITVYTSGEGLYKTIQDTSIFAGTPNYIGGNLDRIYVGQVSTMIDGIDRNFAKAFIKLPGLYQYNPFQSLDEDEITSLNLYLYESFGVPLSSTVTTRIYTGSIWDESSLTYNTSTPTYTTSYGSININGGGWYSFNLTDVAKQWRMNNYDPAKGIVFTNSNETSANYCKYFNSTEASSNKPYFVLTYTVYANLPEGIYTIKNTGTNKYLDSPSAGSLVQAQQDLGSTGIYNDASQYWYIKPKANGWYEISSLYLKHEASYGQTLYTFTVQTSAGYPVATNVNTDAINQEWKFVYSGGAYNIISKAMLDYKLYVANSTATPAITQNPSSNYNWSITSVNFANHWDGKYTNYTTPGCSVVIQPKYSTFDFPNDMYTDESMLDIVTVWNGITPKVTVNAPVRNTEGPIPSSFEVVFKKFDRQTSFVGKDENFYVSYKTMGIVIPYDNGPSTPDRVEEISNNDWYGADLYLSTYYEYPNDPNEKLVTIVHEFGHLLKMHHPFDVYPSDNYVLSVMNRNYASVSNSKTTMYPSEYDKANLRHKWEN